MTGLRTFMLFFFNPTLNSMHRSALIIYLLVGSFFAIAQPSEIAKKVKAHTEGVTTLAISNDGKYLASGGNDKTVKVWTLPGLELKYSAEAHTQAVNALAFSSNSLTLLSGSGDETGNLWDINAGTHLFNFGKTPFKGSGIQFGSEDISIYDVAFSKDGEKILAVGGNVLANRYQLRSYNAKNGEFLKALNIQSNLILGLDIHPDGKSIVTSTSGLSTDASVRLNDLETGALIKEYDKNLSEVHDVSFSPDGKYIAAGSDRSILIWDTKSGEKKATLQGHYGAVKAIVFSPDGKYLVSASTDKNCIVWKFEEAEELIRLNNGSEALSIVFSPDGNTIFVGGGDGKISSWNFVSLLANQPKVEKKAETENDIMPRVRKESFSPFANLKEAPELVIENGTHNDFVQSIKYTPDGKEIVTASWDKTIRIWDATNGKLIRTIHVPSYAGIEGQIFTMDVSPDKKFIAVGGSSVGQRYDKKTANYIGDYVLLIDFKTGKIVDVSANHKQSIFSVTFSPDGKKLASCSGALDNKVIIYSLDPQKGKLTFQEEFVMTGFAREFIPKCTYFLVDVCDHTVLSVRFSSDSKDVFAADAHGMVIRYTLKTATSAASHKLIGESAGRKSGAITGKLTGKAMLRSMATDPKGRYIAAGDFNGKVLIFDSKGGKADEGESSEILLATIPLKIDASVFALDFNATGNLLSVAVGGEVRVYPINLENVTAPVSISVPLVTFKEHIKDAMSVAFSPDGNSVISSGGDSNITYVWEEKTGKVKFKLGGEKFSNQITRVGANPTNPFLIGYGTSTIDQKRINHYGAIQKAFDLKNLTVIESAKESDFSTAESDSKEPSAPPRPEFSTWFNDPITSYLTLSNGQVIIASQGELFVNDAANTMAATGTRAYGMAKSKDGETFYTGQSDGQIKIYDTKTLKLIANLYIADNNEWILFTPDGYYTASKHGSKLVGWLINEGIRSSPKFYPFEQFDLRLNRPNIVLSRIGGLPRKRIELLYKAYQKRLEKMGILESSLTNNLNAPVLEVDLSVTESIQKLITFKVKAEDKENELERLTVYVNDVPLYGAKGFSLKGTPSKSLEKQLIIELTNGQNKIQVSVLNTAGVESFQETRYVNYRGPVVKPNLYILAIGVSDYANDNFDLQYASKDARDIAQLYEQQTGKFGSIKTMTILDKEATREKIKGAKIFLKQARVDDEVILFAAGHGLLDDNLDFYFGTTDVDFNNPAARGLKYNDLEGLLDEVPARKKLMLVDACHSGELDKESVVVSANTAKSADTGVKSRGFKNLTSNDRGITNPFELMRMMFSDLRRGSGAMVISSASGVEFAFENDVWKNGVFTYSLIEGLKTGNANLNKDADVQVSELRDYVIKRVGELTNGKQTPTSRKENLEFDFKVW